MRNFVKWLQSLLLLLALFAWASSSGLFSSELDVESLKPVGSRDHQYHREYSGAIKQDEEATPVRCYTCRCCDKMGMCIDTNCCYGIKCHVPDKPPDMCFFLPMACNCNSCPS